MVNALIGLLFGYLGRSFATVSDVERSWAADAIA